MDYVCLVALGHPSFSALFRYDSFHGSNDLHSTVVVVEPKDRYTVASRPEARASVLFAKGICCGREFVR